MASRHISRQLSRLVSGFGFAAVISAMIAASPVSAADLDYGYQDPPVALPQQSVAFGSGWYVRGDVSATDFPGLQTAPTGLGNAPSISFVNKANLGFSASLGGGYSFTNNIRADAVFDFHQPLHGTASGPSFRCQNGYGTYEPVIGTDPTTGLPVYGPTKSYATYGTCQSNLDARLNSYDVLVNGYYDLGRWFGFTPYVGAGAGLSFGHYQTSSKFHQFDGTPYDVTLTDPVSGSTYHNNYDRSSSGQYYNFAWALMAGVAYDLTNHAKLDIGYRYLNLGTILSSHYALQEGHVGIRYMLDN